MEFSIRRDQLVAALEAVDTAIANGFSSAEAVFRFTAAGPRVSDCLAEFRDPVLKAHPTDPQKNYGRITPGWQSYRFRNGRLYDRDDDPMEGEVTRERDS